MNYKKTLHVFHLFFFSFLRHSIVVSTVSNVMQVFII